MSVDHLIKSGFSRVGVVHVRSALNPFLWSFSWSLVFLGFAAVFREDPLAKYVLLSLSAVPMIVTMAIGCFFAKKKSGQITIGRISASAARASNLAKKRFSDRGGRSRK